MAQSSLDKGSVSISVGLASAVIYLVGSWRWKARGITSALHWDYYTTVPWAHGRVPGPSFNIRKSTNRRCGEVNTMVDVGSLASPGSHRMHLRVEILMLIVM